MNEFEIYTEEVCKIMPDFLNNIDEDSIVKETGDRIAKKFALTQEQRCAVKIVLANIANVYTITGETADPVVAYSINLITHIVLKDWDGVENMMNDKKDESDECICN